MKLPVFIGQAGYSQIFSFVPERGSCPLRGQVAEERVWREHLNRQFCTHGTCLPEMHLNGAISQERKFMSTLPKASSLSPPPPAFSILLKQTPLLTLERNGCLMDSS